MSTNKCHRFSEYLLCTARSVISSYCSRSAICASNAAMMFWMRDWADGAGEVEASIKRGSANCSSEGPRASVTPSVQRSHESGKVWRTGLFGGRRTGVFYHVRIAKLFQLICGITDIVQKRVVCPKIRIQNQPK